MGIFCRSKDWTRCKTNRGFLFLPQVVETNPPQPQDVKSPRLYYALTEPYSFDPFNRLGEVEMKKIFGIVLSVVLLAALAGCAPGEQVQLDKPDSEIQLTTPGPNPAIDQPAEDGKVAGLGTGLWHGLISVVTLVISFTNPDVQMYEVHNTGPLYNLGFLLGAVVLFILLGFLGGKRRR